MRIREPFQQKETEKKTAKGETGVVSERKNQLGEDREKGEVGRTDKDRRRQRKMGEVQQTIG